MQKFENFFDTLYKHMTAKLNKTNQSQYKRKKKSLAVSKHFDFFPWCQIQK